ncbi:MAG: cytochrome c oxidase assembly protein [Pseudolabrys sp.]|nr:cytochrome c oxidase assembly protein [Pseudolabrys sp.]MBV9261718.1 cytochrome c oxidase assembly protein [Pseudolabrys sp.]
MSAKRNSLRRDAMVAASCGAFVALMVGAAYAAVPLYNWFCRTTGFAGTTQVSTVAPAQVLDRTIKVRFDSNVMQGLPWRFAPEQNEITVHIGEVVTAYYKVTNEAARETVAQASYNVAPLNVGSYFNKINCFCFTEQRMKAGETRDMAVVFYVDPSIAKDADQNDLHSITLSYTFYPLREPAKPLADAGASAVNKL